MITTIENHQLKGITIKNVIVTIVSTASIVASVVTTYFGLKADIQTIKSTQETETRVNNVRISLLESEVNLLQKEVDDLRPPVKSQGAAAKNSSATQVSDLSMLSAISKK